VVAARQAVFDLLKAQIQLDLDLEKAQKQLDLDLLKAREQTPLDIDKAQQSHFNDLQKARHLHEQALEQAVHDAYVDVAKSTIDRALARADFVEKAAAAIATAYTAVVGLSFATGTDATPIPPQGIIPAIFLGFALVLAAVYLAYFSRSAAPERKVAMEPPAPAPDFETKQRNRLNEFVGWTSNAVLARIYFLHASVISLGFGVLFLPAAYIAWSGRFFIGLAVGGGVTVFLLPLLPALGVRASRGWGGISKETLVQSLKQLLKDAHSALSWRARFGIGVSFGLAALYPLRRLPTSVVQVLELILIAIAALILLLWAGETVLRRR
jgi:hypothetical protein